jgi:hypothetical protein
MGMEHIVQFPGRKIPELSQVMRVLADHKFAAQVRMVDRELTMPDEALPERWGEVRLGTPSGMVTVVRRGDAFHIVTWGNADEAMQRAWNAVAWAAAKAGDGQILRPEGAQAPDEFRNSAAFPDALRQ